MCVCVCGWWILMCNAMNNFIEIVKQLWWFCNWEFYMENMWKYIGMNCLLWWMEISIMRIWVMHGMTCETVVFFLVESVILFILILVI